VLPMLVGTVSSTAIVVLSGSSGPLITYFSAVLALTLCPIRRYMRGVRWGIVGLLLLIQVMMSEPLWFIFGHVNVLSGSTGWHRSHLIDQTIRHFFDWWIAGTDLSNVSKWGVWWADVTNQYLLEGLNGGVITMVLFVAIIVSAFSNIGRAVRSASRDTWVFIWAVGAAVFSHVMTFMSVAYFDQNSVNWSLVLAMAATLGAQSVVALPRQRERTSALKMGAQQGDWSIHSA
jgi:hypothetical protein